MPPPRGETIGGRLNGPDELSLLSGNMDEVEGPAPSCEEEEEEEQGWPAVKLTFEVFVIFQIITGLTETSWARPLKIRH